MGSVNKERLEVELMTKLDNDLWSFVKYRYMLALKLLYISIHLTACINPKDVSILSLNALRD